MNKYLLSVLLLIVLVFGAFVMLKSKKEEKQYRTVKKESVERGATISTKYMEGSPFVWKNKLYYLLSERNDKQKKFTLSIVDYANNKKISSSFGAGLSLASAYVEEDVVYIFGTMDWTTAGKSAIYRITTSDLTTFSKAELVYSAKVDQKIFNTSVTKNTDTQEYYLAYEVDESGLTPFTIRFLSSPNLSEWNITDKLFGKDTYVACPTIKYSKDTGFYYLLFGKEFFYDPNCSECKVYITSIARSTDLNSWDTSATPFLVPRTNSDEGTSAADVDLIEHDEKVYMTYSISDQATWGGMKKAQFNGKQSDLFSSFFD